VPISTHVRRLCAGLAGSLLAFAHAAPAVPSAAAVAPCPGADLQPNEADLAAVNSATLCVINRVRATYHVRAVRPNRELGRVAADQVDVMVRMNFFADVRPTGQTALSLVAASRYPARAPRVSVGQNIAWATGRDASPAMVVAAWMASPPHRRIMLDGEYRDAGVAATPATPSVLGQDRGGATYALLFGVRLR
jgi:uncharacterized protein YkwD